MPEVSQPSAAPAASPVSPAAPATPSQSPLEKVYSDFNIEAEAATFQPKQPAAPQPPAAPTAPVTPKIPDPFDPNFQAYQASLAQGYTVLNQALSQTRGELTALQQQLHQQRTEADIKQAVGTIAEKAGIEPEIAEVALEAKARQDPKFLAIWNNRAKNQKAYQAALQAITQEFQQKFTVRQDPQLAENQRAVKAAQQHMATRQQSSDGDKWANMTYEERRAETARLRRMGGG